MNPTRQTWILVRNALRMDFRPRGTRERGLRAARPFLLHLFSSLLMGLLVASTLATAGLPVLGAATLAYAFAGVLLLLNLMADYQEILLAPTDGDVLYWRPITSRTLYVARVLHVLLYVGGLGAALLLPPAIVVARAVPARAPAVLAGFAAGGLANTLFVTSAVLVLHGTLLRRLHPERFQEVLGQLQIALIVGVVAGMQLLRPEMLQQALGTTRSGAGWLPFLPAAWFATLPSLAAGEAPSVAQMAGMLGGAGVLLASGAHALGQLAPRYQAAVESVRVAAGTRAVKPHRRLLPERLLRAWLGRRRLRLAGFDFFLAQLRGDRRVRLGLVPIAVLPLGFVVAGLVQSGGVDPYVLSPAPAAALDAQGGGGREVVQSQWTLFMAMYFLATFGAVFPRAMQRSPDWRAAWVFHAAPLGRIDELHAGVLWGALYGLLLPAVGLVALALLVAWQDPLHVLAHLAVPLGLASILLASTQGIGFAPAFSREPQRHERGRDTLLTLGLMLPVGLVTWGHWWFRGRPALLVAAGLALGLVSWPLWWLANRRIRACFHRLAFAG